MTPSMRRVLLENLIDLRWTPEGVEWWSGAKDRTLLQLRRESKSPGRGYSYMIVEVRNGNVRASGIQTARGLYRALLAIEAEHDEPKPKDRPGISWYAKRQTNRNGTATVWVSRRRPFSALDGCLCRSYYDRTGEHAVGCPLANDTKVS